MIGIIALLIRILMALALLGFIFVLFTTIWRQLKTQLQMISPELTTFVRMVPIEPSLEDAVEIKQSEVLIGRDPNCKVFIPNETVSAQHGRLYFADQHWWINDLNSTNGTFLNDEAIDRPCVLTENDVLSFGEVKFKIQIFTNAD